MDLTVKRMAWRSAGGITLFERVQHVAIHNRRHNRQREHTAEDAELQTTETSKFTSKIVKNRLQRRIINYLSTMLFLVLY